MDNKKSIKSFSHRQKREQNLFTSSQYGGIVRFQTLKTAINVTQILVFLCITHLKLFNKRRSFEYLEQFKRHLDLLNKNLIVQYYFLTFIHWLFVCSQTDLKNPNFLNFFQDIISISAMDNRCLTLSLNS